MTKAYKKVEAIASITDDFRGDRALTRTALKYAAAGTCVFACTRDGKAPAISNEEWSKYLGKEVPKGKGGFHKASTDPENLIWQFNRPNAGTIGMPTGRINSVIVLDLDVHKEKDRIGNANDVLRKYWDEFEECHTVKTQSGGWHVYFDYVSGRQKKELGENIEVQTDGAYVLLPPSKGYKVERLVMREDWPKPCWPQGVPTLDRENVERLETADIVAMQNALKKPGEWHNNMVRLTAHMVATGWSDFEIITNALRWVQPGYDMLETLEEVNTAVAGARIKYWRDNAGKKLDDRALNAVEAIKKNIPRLTAQQLKDLTAQLRRMTGQ